MSVSEISDDELLRRAVTQARMPGPAHSRYVAVMQTFMLGSTYAAELCRRFDLDPFEKVKR